MAEMSVLVLTFIAGIVPGKVFFGGLWWTIRSGVSSQGAGLWFAVSFLLRTAIAVGGLYFISSGDWRRMLVALCGIIVARVGVVRLTRLPVKTGKPIGAGGAS
jgi:F1F0 ATPase subunit 2